MRRLDTSIALQVEKFHAEAEGRRKEREAARLKREAALAERWVWRTPAWAVVVARASACVAVIAATTCRLTMVVTVSTGQCAHGWRSAHLLINF